MRLDIDNKICILYKQIDNYIIGTNILFLDKDNIDINNIDFYFKEILNTFKKMGFDYLCTNPPTYNPLLALKLIECSDNSRIFAGPVEIVRGTKAFDKYIMFLSSFKENKIQCIVDVGKTLVSPVYMSYPLNGRAMPPFRYICYDDNGDVVSIVNERPNIKNFDTTDRFYMGDENKFDINIIKKSRIEVRRKK